MTLMARYSGVCPECGKRWQPGELIRAGEDRQWKHVHCPDVTDDLSLRPSETVCADCWLIHPQGVCDR